MRVRDDDPSRTRMDIALNGSRRTRRRWRLKSSAAGKLSDGFAGKIVYLDDPGYAAARAVSNSMIDRRRR